MNNDLLFSLGGGKEGLWYVYDCGSNCYSVIRYSVIHFL